MDLINNNFCGWTRQLPERSNFKLLDQDIYCDYLIVGAGYTGLSAARKLSDVKKDKKIVLIDAQLAGEGGSSRNSGYLVDTTLNDGFTSNSDKENYVKKTKNPSNCFAKRFAAKEALFKAVGIRNKLQFNDVEIKNNPTGLPTFHIKGSSLKNLKKIFKNKRFKIHLSLSDDEPWAVATAIIFII